MPVKISAADFEAATPADPIAGAAQEHKPPAVQTEIPDLSASDIGAETIADKLAEGFPEDKTRVSEFGPAIKDSNGVDFDPKKHRMDAEGKPLFNADGRFSKRYSKRNDKGDEDEYDATATMLTAGLFKLFGAVFDPEEAEPDPEFRATIHAAYATALRSKGISITDPVWNAIGLTGIYGFTVIQKPKSRVKAASLWEKVKGKLFKRKNQPIETI
jgi:hypothetical protein